MTIFETLQNAEYNLVKNRMHDLCFDVGKAQLRNAIALLDKGYGLFDDVEPLLKGVQHIEDVPEKASTT